MMHFGILSLPVTSHLNVFLTIGEELARRGHQVTLIGLPGCFDSSRAPGIRFLPLTTERAASEIMTYFERSARGTLKAQIDFDRLYYRTVVANAPDLIRKASIDRLICDQALICASTVAEIVKLSFASVCCGLPLNRGRYIPPFFSGWTYRRTWWAALRNAMGYGIGGLAAAPIARDLNRLRKRAGLQRLKILDDSFSPHAQISQQTRDFDYPRESLPSTFHYVGPIRPPRDVPIPFPFERLTGDPLVYCTLGTTVNQRPRIFGMIAEACSSLHVQLVITLGRGCVEADIPKLTESQIVVDYAPQLELLKRASLTIAHAGMITSLDSLSCGVPIVAIPILFEQPAIAARIAFTGAGIVIPPDKLTVPALRSAITSILTVPTYRESAARLRHSLQTANGLHSAAAILEALPAADA